MTYESPVAEVVPGEVSIPAAMEAFSNLADLWELSTDDQISLLGSPGRSTFFKWKKSGGNLPQDTVERISQLLGIYKALQILIPDEGQADSWIRRPNKYFKNRTALDVMLDGQFYNIYQVRQYLDAQRGG
jgi:uncharacterized protein (DUF2384 family)